MIGDSRCRAVLAELRALLAHRRRMAAAAMARGDWDFAARVEEMALVLEHRIGLLEEQRRPSG